MDFGVAHGQVNPVQYFVCPDDPDLHALAVTVLAQEILLPVMAEGGFRDRKEM